MDNNIRDILKEAASLLDKLCQVAHQEIEKDEAKQVNEAFLKVIGYVPSAQEQVLDCYKDVPLSMASAWRLGAKDKITRTRFYNISKKLVEHGFLKMVLLPGTFQPRFIKATTSEDNS